ncbi:MAG: 4'-phosphopantetheinyl transferase superfamily protein [Desulfobacteraceae bacterium]|nr:MAG: 4'-phosphopantetheinyl transferase superfamily protein [Desulfobacteraceae bacterium]
MEDVPKVNRKSDGSILLPVDFPVQPYLLDHRFEGRAVLPAVEAMQTLAEAVSRFRPDAERSIITHARFEKFLYIDGHAARVSASVELEELENGDITASLQTKSTSGKLSITRVREHAALCFPCAKPDSAVPPADLVSALQGVCLEIPCERIYRDLVPFGPSFQNVRGSLLVSREGAIAWTAAPSIPGYMGSSPLGSPFPLDAAFHAACAWGQRYAGIVAFPVAVEKRIILRPTVAGSTYLSRIIPVRVGPDLLVFDIWIYDERGDLVESACGVSMRDVSAGRMKPPEWVADSGAEFPPGRIRESCLEVSVVELRTILPFADKALSDKERERFLRLGEPRRRSYLAARIACKRAYRALLKNDVSMPASEITTVCADPTRPCCPVERDHPPLFCSVSHDDRFAIAVIGENRVGVDVERLSERPLKALHIYMKESERVLTRQSVLGEKRAALRVWTLKEAAAKAFDMNLAESWKRVKVVDIGCFESRFQLDGECTCTAMHEEVEEHLFTLISALSAVPAGKSFHGDPGGPPQKDL